MSFALDREYIAKWRAIQNFGTDKFVGTVTKC